MKSGIITILLAVPLLLCGFASADSIVVIVNAANKEPLSAESIKSIYSDIVSEWSGGQGMKLFELPAKSPLREVFSQKILGMSATESEAAWSNRKITNTIKNQPKTSRESLVVDEISKNPVAIGYVSKDAISGKENIRVVLTVE